jgi:hypothetical protein
MRTDPEVRLIRAILLLVGIALFGVVVMVGVVNMGPLNRVGVL